MAQSVTNNNEIMVSVDMPTYNHADYIVQAIESVLMQKVNFRYELVIGDDASTDGTQEVVIEYAKKYPDIIVPLCHKKNVGIIKNSISIKKRLRGKYIAILEGDDFWIDENKLQKQVDFMEKHPEYSLCFTSTNIIKDTTGGPVFTHRDILSIEDYLNHGKGLLGIPTPTMLFRNVFRENLKLLNYFNSFIGDRVIQTIMLQYGKFKYLPFKSATYRYITKTGTSYSGMKPCIKYENRIKFYKTCVHIVPKSAHLLWYRSLTNSHRDLLNFIANEEGKFAAFRYFLHEMNIICKYYLIRDSLIDKNFE